MTNKLKIKLTKEQIDILIACVKCSFPIPTLIEIHDDQIIKEKTNAEKWREIIIDLMSESYHSSSVNDPQKYLANKLDAMNYNADAAYKEVVGGE